MRSGRISLSAVGQGRFNTTQWSQVLQAGQGDGSHADHALAGLCACYWHPLYFFARSRGMSVEDAQDATQDFFTTLLEKKTLANVSREGGRFRSFLLAAFKHYLSNRRQHENAKKRGGEFTVFSLDFESAEGEFQYEPVDSQTPETLYEKRWAFAVLNICYERLEAECEKMGKLDVFLKLRPFLTGENEDMTYKDVAGELKMSEAAIKTAVHRLRKQFGKILRDEIRHTLDSDAVDEEIQHLFSVIS